MHHQPRVLVSRRSPDENQGGCGDYQNPGKWGAAVGSPTVGGAPIPPVGALVLIRPVFRGPGRVRGCGRVDTPGLHDLDEGGFGFGGGLEVAVAETAGNAQRGPAFAVFFVPDFD